MKLFSFISLLFFLPTFFNLDINDDLLAAFRQNKSSEISKYFDEKVSMKIINQEDVLSKSQAEANLNYFLEKHIIKSVVKQKTTVINSYSHYLNALLECENEKFRLTILDRRNLIAQMRIELMNE